MTNLTTTKRKNMRNVIITTLITTVMAVSFNANARFSVKLEYELMRECVGYFKSSKKINICSCAIDKSNYRYPDDSSYHNNDKGFDNVLKENVEICKAR
jgi:hypothetical protein